MEELEPVKFTEYEKNLEAPIISRLATPFSVNHRDKDGRSAWFYFCTKTIPHVLNSKVTGKSAYLANILSILVQNGAATAYEQATDDEAPALLVSATLESVNDNTDDDDSHAAILAEFLLDAICTSIDIGMMIKHPKIVELLIWSVLDAQKPLLRKLLELGVDVHAKCDFHRFGVFYQDESAMDNAIEGEVDLEILSMLLIRAQPNQIPTVKKGKLQPRHFDLLMHSKRAHSESHSRLKSFEALLEAGLDPDARSSNLVTAAMVAASAGSVEALQMLARFRADFTLVNKDGWTVVHHAMAAGQVSVLKYLRHKLMKDEDWSRRVSVTLGPGGPLTQSRYFNWTLTHLAAYKSDSDVLQFLKETDLLGDVDTRDQEDITPLHVAVCSITTATTKWLIDNGANVNARYGVQDNRALHVAMRLGRLENSLALIEAGADFAANSIGVTPEMQVHMSIRTGLLSMLPQLGLPIPPTVYEVLKRDHKLQSTGGLFRAITSGNLEMCHYAMKELPELPQTINSCGDCTPLIVALAWQQPNIAKLFLEHGASTTGIPCQVVQKRGVCFDSALNIAVGNPSFNPILEQILERSLEYEMHWTQNPRLWMPLHLAAAFNPDAIEILLSHVFKYSECFRSRLERNPGGHRGGYTFLDELLECRAPISPKGTNPWYVPGGTALHTAAIRNKPKAVEILLGCNLDIDVKDTYGSTALHYSAVRGHIGVTEKLLERGANFRTLNYKGASPLMTAARSRATGRDVMSCLTSLEPNRLSEDLEGQTALHYAALGGNLKSFIHLLDAGWDPYQLDEKQRSPLECSLCSTSLTSYVYARYFDFAHMISISSEPHPISQFPNLLGLRLFCKWLPRVSRLRWLNTVSTVGDTPLIRAAEMGHVGFMKIHIEAGADLEIVDRVGHTALIAACRTGRLPVIAYLVHQGAKMEYTHESCIMNALRSAIGHPEIVRWFLVDRWTAQDKLTNSVSNPEKTEKQWAGIRTVQIPLCGGFERPMGVSLFAYTRDLHRFSREGWRRIVPLAWDTIAHLVLLPEEL
ncbi:ankyrin repeat-containing domain protein [Paraphoma chrysanthemicola]|uniref:Ankyrin repeat-containing domain protein n=1 Tax=Paraphoma chrysanthemicola TaxID=798071 RepID=A0A8K0VRT1_9PLEO|nr:ankyrin repeat-containing domain protein [Paraphoma chrysanthemicola]